MEQQIDYKLEHFEGPLDLLLLLIEKNKVDIYDIPIAEITDQYIAHVEQMETEDLDELSDFLVLASTLLDIKARMLLPKEEDENGEEIDPRDELAARLQEYREYKAKAEELRAFYEEADGMLFKEATVPEEVLKYRPPIDYEELLDKVTLDRLKEIFESVLQRQEDKIDPVRSTFGEIEKDRVRISDKFTYLSNFAKTKKHFSFRELLEGQKTRSDVVVTFLACLEYIRIGRLNVRQETTCGDIEMDWNDDCDVTITEEELEEYE